MPRPASKGFGRDELLSVGALSIEVPDAFDEVVVGEAVSVGAAILLATTGVVEGCCETLVVAECVLGEPVELDDSNRSPPPCRRWSAG